MTPQVTCPKQQFGDKSEIFLTGEKKKTLGHSISQKTTQALNTQTYSQSDTSFPYQFDLTPNSIPIMVARKPNKDSTFAVKQRRTKIA